MPPFDFHNLLIFNLGEVAFLHPLALWIGLPLLAPVGWFLYVWQRRSLTSAPRSLCGVLTGLRLFILAALCFYLAQAVSPRGARRPAEAGLRRPVRLFAEHGPAGRAVRDGRRPGENRRRGRLRRQGRRGRSRNPQGPQSRRPIQAGPDGADRRFPHRMPCRGNSTSAITPSAADLTQLGVNPSKPDFPDPPHPGGKSTQIGDALDQLRADVRRAEGGRRPASSPTGRTPPAGRSPKSAGPAPTPTCRSFPCRSARSASSRTWPSSAWTPPARCRSATTVRVAATIESKGFDKRVVKVAAVGRRSPGQGRGEPGRGKEVTLSDTEQQHVDLTFKATKAGAHYLTVKVPPQPEEPDYLRGNNADTAFVRVSDEKIKVLLSRGPAALGLPLPQERHAPRQRPDRPRRQGAGHRAGDGMAAAVGTEDQQAALPRTLDQLAEYHTIILGDVSPKMLDRAFVELLVKAVRERGVGLIVEAGPLLHAAQVRRPARRPAAGSADARPRRQDAQGDVRRSTSSWRRRASFTTPCGCSTTRPPTRTAGRRCRRTTGAPRPRRRRPAPRCWCGTRSISPAGGKTPLIAQSYAGQGQVLFVGTDSTWLWRQNVGDRFFYKFWGQAIRAVARNDKTTQKKSWLEVRPVHVEPGDAARVELMAFAADGSPRTDPTLTVQVQIRRRGRPRRDDRRPRREGPLHRQIHAQKLRRISLDLHAGRPARRSRRRCRWPRPPTS